MGNHNPSQSFFWDNSKMRNMKNFYKIVLMSFLMMPLVLLNGSHQLSAREINISEAVGLARLYSGEEKQARDAALRDAMKKAIEQGVGSMMESETEVKNFQLLSDRILSKSKGVIKNYKILREGEVDNGVNYEVVISAIVDDQLMEDSMEAFRLMQELTGRKTVMVIYNPKVQGELPLNPKRGDDFNLIKSAMIALNQGFINKRFDVIEPSVLQEVIRDTETLALSNEADFDQAVSELAAKYGAQYYTTFELLASNKKNSSVFEAKTIIRAKLYNVGSARIINQLEGKGKKKYRQTDSGADIFEAMTASIRQSAKQIRQKLTDSLIERLYEYAEDGAPMMIRFYTDKPRFQSIFQRMIKKIEGVTGSKTITRNRNELFMHVYYQENDADEFLGSVEDSFYSNRQFKGYALIPGQMGDVIQLNMEME